MNTTPSHRVASKPPVAAETTYTPMPEVVAETALAAPEPKKNTKKDAE